MLKQMLKSCRRMIGTWLEFFRMKLEGSGLAVTVPVSSEVKKRGSILLAPIAMVFIIPG